MLGERLHSPAKRCPGPGGDLGLRAWSLGPTPHQGGRVQRTCRRGPPRPPQWLWGWCLGSAWKVPRQGSCLSSPRRGAAPQVLPGARRGPRWMMSQTGTAWPLFLCSLSRNVHPFPSSPQARRRKPQLGASPTPLTPAALPLGEEGAGLGRGGFRRRRCPAGICSHVLALVFMAALR